MSELTKLSFELRLSASPIEEFFARKVFAEVPETLRIAYTRKRAAFIVWTILPQLDEELEERVFDIEDMTYTKYDNSSFDSYILTPEIGIPNNYTVLEQS